MFRRIWFKNVFIKYLSTYILVMMVPMVFMAILFQDFSKDINRVYSNQSTILLDQINKQFETSLQSLEKSVDQLTKNEHLVKLAQVRTKTEQDNSVLSIELLKQDISRFLVRDILVNYANVTFHKSGLIVSSSSVIKKNNESESIFSYNNLNSSEWTVYTKTKFFSHYYDRGLKPLIFNQEKDQTLLYMQSFPLESDNPLGVVSCFLSQKALLELLEPSFRNEQTYIYVLDGNDNLLLSNHPNEENSFRKQILPYVDGEDKFETVFNGEMVNITVKKSDYNEFRFVAMISKSDAVSYSRNHNIRMLFSFIIALFVGVIFSYIFSINISMPIQNILMLLKEPEPTLLSQPRLNFIQNKVRNIVDENSKFEVQIKAQKKLLKNNFYQKLIDGNIYHYQEIEQYIKHMDIKVINPPIYCIHIKMIKKTDNKKSSFLTLEEIESIKQSFCSCIEKYFQDFYINAINLSQMMLLISEEKDKNTEESNDAIEELLLELQSLVDSNFVKFVFGISNPVLQLLDLHIGYEQAKGAISGSCSDDHCIYWYQSMPSEGDMYFYPINLEQQIITVMLAGDKKGLKCLLDSVSKENFQNRTLNTSNIKHLLNNLIYTLFKAISQIKYFEENEIEAIRKEVEELTLNDISIQGLEDIANRFLLLCENISLRKNTKQDMIGKEIKIYLDENYSNPQLNMSMLADHFGFSEGYFSRLFKSTFSKPFSVYLEERRLQEAKELLVSTQYTLSDIAVRSGYHSYSVFRRAFKRVMQINPGDYRQSRK